MSSPKDVPFARASRFEKGAARRGKFELAGEESAAPQEAPPLRDAAASPDQRARADDMFLRGALTPEQLARAKASRGGFEVVIGKSNFLPAVFLEIGAATSRATCQVRTSGTDFRGQPGAWTGTGFLLGPSVLVTNHHVLNSPEVAAAAMTVFNFQLGTDGRPLPPRSFRLRPDRLFLTSPTRGGLDYTFCWVEGEPGREFGSVRVDRGAFTIAEEEFANVISHPAGRMKEISIQQNEVQWQDDVVVHYTSDTEPGSSGASVCNNTWQLVALHHASKPSNVDKYPVLNEGIKLSAIAADLDRMAGAGTPVAVHARDVLGLFGGTDERLGFFGSLGRTAGTADGMEAVVTTYQGTDQDVDVGFWNVEWLTKHYDTKATAVARVMKELNLDVWSLEESSPNAADAVVAELTKFGLNYATLPAEGDAPDGKQSCSILWNTETMTCQRAEWGPTIEEWLGAKSQQFDDLDLGLEAIHGKIFDRYPALFQFTTKAPVSGQPFAFFLVAVHLKAMAEGSLRRRMASKILAAVVKKKIGEGAGRDWIIGGDFNAELATDDFADPSANGMVAASAEDEAGGAFSYIKGPRSLIDHIFLSPNLADRFGPQSYFIVAAEKTFPNYVADISDHRPVLVRMSLNGTPEAAPSAPRSGAAKAPKESAALKELKARLAASANEPASEDGTEAARKKARPVGRRGPRRADDYDDRTGYDPQFLGGGSAQVPLPKLAPAQTAKAVVVNERLKGDERFVLPYTHFSVVMNGERKLPFFTAVNIDGTLGVKIVREGDSWILDPRISHEFQSGKEVYAHSDLDRGHIFQG